MIQRRVCLLIVPTLLLCTACDQSSNQQVVAVSPPATMNEVQSPTPPGGAAGTEATEIEWDALIPADWQPEKLMDQYNPDELSDTDPRAQELLEKLKALWEQAPVVPGLEGRRVRIPGFIVPLDTDEKKKIGEFLLVPYYGACIHVPPPPANQTIYVVTQKGREYQGELFDVAWVTGTIRGRTAVQRTG